MSGRLCISLSVLCLPPSNEKGGGGMGVGGNPLGVTVGDGGGGKLGTGGKSNLSPDEEGDVCGGAGGRNIGGADISGKNSSPIALIQRSQLKFRDLISPRGVI